MKGTCIMATRGNELSGILSVRLRRIIAESSLDYDNMQEIRLRINKPFVVFYNNDEILLDDKGNRTDNADMAYRVTPADIKETLEYISNYSLYAYEDEVRQGFITIAGGHRVGLAGKVVLEGNRIKSVKYISFINIRLSHQIKGCSNKILPFVVRNSHICHTLIISPPGCGKTTLLRDLIRMISDGYDDYDGVTVGVVDERSEIGACYRGVPQNDLGMRTDVLDCCPKSYGMMMLIRSMSPRVIAVDEIGGREDIDTIYDVINCGCRIIATVHGDSIDDIRNRPGVRKLIEERIFERYIVLNNKGSAGNIENIFDERGSCLYGME